MQQAEGVWCTAGLSVGDVSQIAYLWHKTHVPFHKAGVDVPLMFRTATDADVKNFTGRHQSRYLWKLPVKKALKVVEHKEAGVSEKRKHDLYDNDGDINMEDAEVCRSVTLSVLAQHARRAACP